MPKARRSSYNMAFKLKVVAEAEAVENNSEIAREYGLSESMVRRWHKDQAKLFNGELKMSAKRTTMGRFPPKYPELDQQPGNELGILYPESTTWMTHRCASNFHQGVRWSSPAAERFP